MQIVGGWTNICEGVFFFQKSICWPIYYANEAQYGNQAVNQGHVPCPLTVVHLVAERAEVEGQSGDREHRQDDYERGRHQDDGEGLDAALLCRRHGGGRQIARVPPQAPTPIVLRRASIVAAHAVICGVRVFAHVGVRGAQCGPPADRVSAAVRCVISALRERKDKQGL